MDAIVIHNANVMNKNELILRHERPSDYREAETLTREAFWNLHVPGCDEHYLLHNMRSAEAFIPELDFVAEYQGKLLGQIVYTHACIAGDDGQQHPVLSFGPVAVLPAFQGQGIGSLLIRHSLQQALTLGHRAVLIYGDPDYYSRLGFCPAENFRIRTADNNYMPPLQALELVAGALNKLSGRFLEDDIYHIDSDAALAFDHSFPPKTRLSDLPSQKKFLEMLTQQKPFD